VERFPLELMTGVPALLAVAELGSATRAAHQLQITTATVLRRIDNIESRLGVRLFDRLPTGLVATAALAAVLPFAEQCAAALDGMRREVDGLDLAPAGDVRVAVPPTIASHLLVPRIPELRQRCPKITVEFASATAIVDLAQREADLALRVVKPSEGDLVLRKLSDYRMVVACAPSLVETARTDPESLPWISWEQSMAHIPEARWLAAMYPDASIALRASELSTMLRAARAGVGALLTAEPLAALEGGLLRVPLERPTPDGSLWLVAHRALRVVPRVAAVWTWLEDYFLRTTPGPELELADAWT
jgi:DNA-binding transcriptional LysR family regulator